MRLKVKVAHKYQVESGTSQRTGNAWTRQEIKFVILREDGTESPETIVASTTNQSIIIDPTLVEGAVGTAGVWMNAEEYNGRCYQRINLGKWEVAQAQQPAAQPAAQQFTPEQLQAAAAALQKQQQGGSGLPF